MKKKILFCVPRLNTKNIRFISLPHLGLLTLIALTDKEKFDIELIDENVDKLDLKKKYDLVCITISNGIAKRAYAIASYYRKQGSEVILGGPHVTIMPNEASRAASSIVIGECEEIWGKILNDFLCGNLKKRYHQAELTSLLDQPIIDFSYCNGKYLLTNVVQTTRGCPNNCNFCSIKKLYGTRIRHVPLNRVVEQIVDARKTAKGFFKSWVFIVDDNICADKAYSKDLFKCLMPLGIRIAAESCISIADDDEMLDLARKVGVRCLYIGFESLSQYMLDMLHKRNSVALYEVAVKKINSYGIAVMGSFMLDIEHSNHRLVKNTLNFCQDNLELAAVFPFIPISVPDYQFNTEHICSPDFENMVPIRISNWVNYFYTKYYSPKNICKRIIGMQKKLRPSMKSTIMLAVINFYLCIKFRLKTP